jgi:hypothetical protein
LRGIIQLARFSLTFRAKDSWHDVCLKGTRISPDAGEPSRLLLPDFLPDFISLEAGKS